MRPFMIMIHAKYWSPIKVNWKKSCRMLGSDCDMMLESVDQVIIGLDDLIKKLGAAKLPPQ